ncbi:hypothetical protein PMAYCL1PPCAC_04681, partial [Pristionchus mayeri]
SDPNHMPRKIISIVILSFFLENSLSNSSWSTGSQPIKGLFKVGVVKSILARGVDYEGFPVFPCPDGILRIAYDQTLRYWIFDGFSKAARMEGCNALMSIAFERTKDQFHVVIFGDDADFERNTILNFVEEGSHMGLLTSTDIPSNYM